MANGMDSASQDNLAQQVLGVPRHVVYRDFVSETVLLNIQTGQYHGLNPTAGQMLRLLDQLNRIGAVAEAIAKEFDQPLERVQSDLTALCEGLLERGLLEIRSTDG
jgi:hypothetical protein